MKPLTKQEQKDEANKAYLAIAEPAYKAYEEINDPAWKAYEAKIKEINAQPDEVKTVITLNGREYKLMEDK